MRIVFWNIMHGGGGRASKIADQVIEWNPDVVALAEFRGTAANRSIAEKLSDAGLQYQLSTADAQNPSWNALCLTSRYELAHVHLDGAPSTDLYWLLAEACCNPALHIGVVHVPLDEYMPGFWKEYRSSLLHMARNWKLGPSLFLGDMNSAISGLDEETTYSLGYKDSFMFPM